MSAFLTLDDMSCAGKIVLVRADLNVPVQDGRITDTLRIDRLWPTVKELAAAGAKVVLLSHFERPKGKPDPRLSLRPIAAQMSDLWQRPVAFAEDCVGPVAKAAIDALPWGGVLVLENTRFHPGEEPDDAAFAGQLAALGDIFVNDAFSASHRANASTCGVARYLPALAGRSLQVELQTLDKALEHPARPVAAIVGGAKISSKLDLLHNIVGKTDLLVLGGAMANTFLAAQGVAIGASRFEEDMLDAARAIMAAAAQRQCRILLPLDVVVAEALAAGVAAQTVDVAAIPADKMILDVGPKSVAAILDQLANCRTVVWNGPLGVFEIPPFDQGTTAVAQGVAALTQRGALLSVAGGGDTAAALAHAGVIDRIGYLSTGGGAFLEWLEGKDLPAIAALKNARKKTAA